MTDQTAAPTRDSRLKYFHVTFFACVMGLAGLTLALHRAEAHFQVPQVASLVALVLTIAAFVAVAGLFCLKAIRYPQALHEEWHHPVKMAFFPAISISLLLVGTALRMLDPRVAEIIWLSGVSLQAILTFAVITGWIGGRAFQPAQMTPAWFIPAVGNVVVPLSGVGFGYIELSWFFFSLGLIFWIILLTLVVNRLIFHNPLPGKLLPTLVILIAPPALAFQDWMLLTGGQIDPFARILFYGALVFAIIVAIQARSFAKLPFALSWWALSFPVAALTVATLGYAEATGIAFFDGLSLVFLTLLVCILAGLVARTALAIARDEVCHPE